VVLLGSGTAAAADDEGAADAAAEQPGSSSGRGACKEQPGSSSTWRLAVCGEKYTARLWPACSLHLVKSSLQPGPNWQTAIVQRAKPTGGYATMEPVPVYQGILALRRT
jgi:hypothetical protein